MNIFKLGDKVIIKCKGELISHAEVTGAKEDSITIRDNFCPNQNVIFILDEKTNTWIINNPDDLSLVISYKIKFPYIIELDPN